MSMIYGHKFLSSVEKKCLGEPNFEINFILTVGAKLPSMSLLSDLESDGRVLFTYQDNQ